MAGIEARSELSGFDQPGGFLQDFAVMGAAFAGQERVYGMTGVGGVQGSLVEFAAVDAGLLAPKPSNLPMREAAALPLILIAAISRARLGHACAGPAVVPRRAWP